MVKRQCPIAKNIFANILAKNIFAIAKNTLAILISYALQRVLRHHKWLFFKSFSKM